MGRGMAAAALCLLLLALGSARGDLTGQLVEDSDQMANIVGARETMSLVDYSLKKVLADGRRGRGRGRGWSCGLSCVLHDSPPRLSSLLEPLPRAGSSPRRKRAGGLGGAGRGMRLPDALRALCRSKRHAIGWRRTQRA
jgi:hypothetical protein